MKNNHLSLKAILSFLVLITCLSKNANTQNSYIDLGAAFSFGINGTVHHLFEQSWISGTKVTVENKKLLLGNSYNFRAGFRHYFNEYIGIGFYGNIIRGNWQNFSSERKIVYVQHKSQSVRCNGFSLAAAFHITTGDYQVNPYFSIMPGFFSGSLDLHDTILYSGMLTTSTWKYKGLNSLFLAFSAGLNIEISKSITLYLECEHRSLTAAPKNGFLISKNGNYDLDEIPIREKRILFVDKLTTDYTQVEDENKPSNVLKPFFPLDNFQLRIGFKIDLSK